MWNKDMSVLLSKGLIFLGLGLAVAIGIWLPDCVGWLEDFYYKPLGHVTSCIFAYTVIVMICALLVFLYLLLENISKKIVFTAGNIKNLRMISWFCFAIAAVLLVWGLLSYLEIIFLTAFVAGFMGLILRILKNVLEEAVSLKEENDFTV